MSNKNDAFTIKSGNTTDVGSNNGGDDKDKRPTPLNPPPAGYPGKGKK